MGGLGAGGVSADVIREQNLSIRLYPIDSEVKVSHGIEKGVHTEFIQLNAAAVIDSVDIITDWWMKRPTEVRIYNVINGNKGDLIAIKQFAEYNNHVCGDDFAKLCEYPTSPSAKLHIEVTATMDAIIVEVDGLLDINNQFAIIESIVVNGHFNAPPIADGSYRIKTLAGGRESCLYATDRSKYPRRLRGSYVDYACNPSDGVNPYEQYIQTTFNFTNLDGGDRYTIDLNSDGLQKCLIFSNNGNEIYPSKYNWGHSDNYCGFPGGKAALLDNKQAVWRVRHLGDDNYVFISDLHSSDRCLIFSNNGLATMPSLYHWGEDNNYCGFPGGKDALIDNRQAIFHLEKLQVEPVAKKQCFGMENYSGQYQFVPASSIYGYDLTYQQCYELDSCNGGLGLSGGGCYKWSDSENGISEPWNNNSR